MNLPDARESLYLLISSVAVFSTLSLSAFNVYLINKPKIVTVVMAQENNQLSDEILFWEDVIHKHPTYRDGYLALSKLYLLKNEKIQSEIALNKAREIDPNY